MVALPQGDTSGVQNDLMGRVGKVGSVFDAPICFAGVIRPDFVISEVAEVCSRSFCSMYTF